MACVLITYQPADRLLSDRVTKNINQLGEAWQPCDNVWLVHTELESSQVLNRLRNSLRSGDDVMVIAVGYRYATNLPEGAKDWLYKNMR